MKKVMNTNNKQPVVEVLDSIMGSGKSKGIIKWMIANPNNRYLYVSPMLSEAEERIPEECESIGFVAPIITEGHRTKSSHLLQLLKEGCNVSFTHKLFEDLTKEHLRVIKEKGYTLIVDEEVDMVSKYSGVYSENDILSLEASNLIKVDEEDMGKIVWTWDDMLEDTRYSRLRRMADLGMLYCAKNRSMMVTQLPLELLTSAKRTIILTYLWEGSLMDLFLKMKGVEVIPFTDFTPEHPESEIIERAKSSIHIKDNSFTRKFKRAGSGFRLTHRWYTETADREQLDEIGKCIRAITRMKENSGKEFMFTMPKSSTERKVGSRTNTMCAITPHTKPEGNYLYPSIRATNDYVEKRICIHLYNRRMNVAVKSYLADYGTEEPDEDKFALSEMIQWVWRSNIREEGGSIDLYIGSERMERLFTNWLSSI